MNIDNQIAALIERKKEIDQATATAARALAMYVATVNILSKADPIKAKILKIGILRNYCSLVGKEYSPLMLKEVSYSEIIIDLANTFGKDGEPND